MGERRFEHGEEYGEGDMYIWDNVSHKEIWAYDDLNEVCDLLNECQSIISALKEENELLKGELELESAKRMHYEQKFFQLQAKELGYNE